MNIEQQLQEHISRVGWAVIAVEGNFAYTVGLTESYNHPEIIITGLNHTQSHPTLNNIGELIKNGERFVAGEFSTDVIENYNVKFEEVSPIAIKDHFGVATRRYGNVKALQCLWPDKDGDFPPECKNEQPYLIKYNGL